MSIVLHSHLKFPIKRKFSRTFHIRILKFSVAFIFLSFNLIHNLHCLINYFKMANLTWVSSVLTGNCYQIALMYCWDFRWQMSWRRLSWLPFPFPLSRHLNGWKGFCQALHQNFFILCWVLRPQFLSHGYGLAPRFLFPFSSELKVFLSFFSMAMEVWWYGMLLVSDVGLHQAFQSCTHMLNW